MSGTARAITSNRYAALAALANPLGEAGNAFGASDEVAHSAVFNSRWLLSLVCCVCGLQL